MKTIGYSKVAAIVAALLPMAALADGMTVQLDHAELLRFKKPVARVIVGNPAVADVNLDSPTLLTVIGKKLGSTSLIVLDLEDKTLLYSRVLVASNGAGNVTVHVSGTNGPVSRIYECNRGECVAMPQPGETGGGGAMSSLAPAAAALAPAK